MTCKCPSCGHDFNPEQPAAKPLTTDDKIALAIRSHVCQSFGVSVEMVVSPIQEHKFTKPRHVAMYLIYKYTGLSQKDVGQLFGNRDHTTVINAMQKCKHSLDTKGDMYHALIALDGQAEEIADTIRQQSFPALMAKQEAA